ncbi:MAG: flagellar hook-length control protein FliK, partial [Syntrophomonas sp.]|nr:flagellar hook-length control protein FliK [Syntrophomonas sp.]
EFLGKMTIKIVLEDGLLTARFITESQQVKHLLDSNLNSLRQNLESQGIRVEKTEVNVQLNNGGLFDGSEGSRQDLWEQPRSSAQYNSTETGSDAYQTSSAGEELEDGFIDSDKTYGIGADGSMNFLI